MLEKLTNYERLDDIEEKREELVRQRALAKRDEKRNDFLKDNLI